MKLSLILFLIIIIFVIIFYYKNKNKNKLTSDDISSLTDQWIEEVTVNNDPDAVAKLFCSDGNLIGTVSQVKRKGSDIKKYFDYFASLPKIQVIAKSYNISKVTSDVFINTAFVTWYWKGLKKPVIARMTFIYRNKCIFQLHSSVLPDLNKSLLKVSNRE
jgi:hypothetical protein